MKFYVGLGEDIIMLNLTKAELRREIKVVLNAMSEDERSVKSEQICDNVLNSGILNNYNNILLYVAMPFEVNVTKLVKFCLLMKKKVFFPKVKGENLEIVEYNGNFEKGAYNILEPSGLTSCEKIDLVIVPVLAVDKLNNRLGKGKGFYDRFLENNSTMKVAVAFDKQILEKIPCTKTDIKMDYIYTN